MLAITKITKIATKMADNMNELEFRVFQWLVQSDLRYI